MATTNIQSFSGDVDVASDLTVTGSATVTSNLTVDTNTLHVDSVAGRVGIGKTDPAYAMDVNGTVNATALYVGGSELTGGGFDPDVDKIAIGTNAGATAQGISTVAVGSYAGHSYQGAYSVAVGQNAGRTSQGGAGGGNATAVGRSAGAYNQGSRSVAMGLSAGQTAQGLSAVALGDSAGQTSQGTSATAVGRGAGQSNQGAYATAVGYLAALTSQGSIAVAVGAGAGQTSQGSIAVAVGYYAGASYQSSAAVAIGKGTATYNQGIHGVAVGTYAARDNQGTSSVAVGAYAGQCNQGFGATALGSFAGERSQSSYSLCVGSRAARYNQATNAVAVGVEAAATSQGLGGTAVGQAAGQYNQGNFALAVGYLAGRTSQSSFATAVGYLAGYASQGTKAIAVGYLAGYASQGTKAIAVGFAAGQYNQPADSTYWSYGAIRGLSGTRYDLYVGTTGEFQKNTSDDRLKHNEKFITGAVKSLFKLRPQEYLKRQKLDATDPEQSWSYEAGLMAQEVYYSAPELRHIVQIPPEAGDIDNYTPPPSDDPTQDPDYSAWGNDVSTVEYKQLTPYLVKAVQEIVTELPRSKTTVSNVWGQNITGLIVSANVNAHKTNTTPIVALSNVYMDKKWYGVVSEKKTDTNDYDTLVDTKGDTQIWVTDAGGPIESGDLVTTSNVAPGYAQKQADGALMNYTVAKVTQDCDFTEPAQRPIRVPKRELSNVTYYRHDASYEIDLEKYERVPTFKTRVDETTIYFQEVTENSDIRNETRYYQGDTEVSETKYDTLPEDERSIKYLSEISVDEYEALDDEAKALYSVGIKKRYFLLNYSMSKTQIPQHDEEVVVEELVDVLNENGQIVWEETDETEPVYTLVDHGSYKAALVSAKLI
jgi:hypothetical protein